MLLRQSISPCETWKLENLSKSNDFAWLSFGPNSSLWATCRQEKNISSSKNKGEKDHLSWKFKVECCFIIKWTFKVNCTCCEV